MRALRVVGIAGDDGAITVVLEDPERRERFTVPADETLRAAARGDLTRLGQIAIEVGNALRPREIQARVRAGASVAELAAEAGVPEQKIERFAYPVLLERSRTAELARLAHPIRADGPDPRTLGEIVAETFGLRGQDYDDATWDSWKGEDGRWVVALSWTAGRSDNRAHWTFQPGASGGTVTTVDEHAGDLVEGLPARPLRTIGPVIDLARADEQPAEATAASQPHVRRAEVRAEAVGAEHRRSDPRAEVTQTGNRRIEHRPDQHRPDQHRADQHRHDPRPTEDRPDQHRPDQYRPSAARPPEGPAETPPAQPAEPAQPAAAEPTTEEAPTAAAPRRTKKGKPVMPSWDEVLLGVKGQR